MAKVAAREKNSVAEGPFSAIFAQDDLPEKWKHSTDINASYVQARQIHA
jgi:hypothetical protein